MIHSIQGYSLAALLLVACSPANGPAVATAEPARVLPVAEYVVGAFADSRGILWFGTMGHGAARVDPAADTSGGSPFAFFAAAQGLPPDGGHAVVEDGRGDLWFAGHDGLYQLPRAATQVLPRLRKETRLATDRQGRVWASTRDSVFRMEGDQRIHFPLPLPDTAPATFKVHAGRAVFQLQDSKGHLWFSTDGHGVLAYDGTDFTRYTMADGLASNTIWRILEDRQGRMWFGGLRTRADGSDGGLSMRAPGAGFVGYPAVKGLAHNDIYTLLEDRAGHIWIGATGLGVYRFDGEDFTLYDRTDRPDLNGGFGLQAMAQDPGGILWFGFSGGLFRFDGKGFRHVGQAGPWR